MSKPPATTSLPQQVCTAFPVAVASWAGWIWACTSRTAACLDWTPCFSGQAPILRTCARKSSHVPAAYASGSIETASLPTKKGVQQEYFCYGETGNPSSAVQGIGLNCTGCREIRQLQVRDQMPHSTSSPSCCSDGAKLLQTYFNWPVWQGLTYPLSGKVFFDIPCFQKNKKNNHLLHFLCNMGRHLLLVFWGYSHTWKNGIQTKEKEHIRGKRLRKKKKLY